MPDLLSDFLGGGATAPTTVPQQAQPQDSAMPKPSRLPSQGMPQPGAPAPVQAPQGAADAAGGGDVFAKLLASQAQQPQSAPAQGPNVMGQPTGGSPEDAVPDSPLSLAQRAALGWVRTPEEQAKYLKQHFDSVSFVPSPDGSGGHFAVKDKYGQWRQADPDFGWDFSNMDNVGKAAGDAAQFVGQYGLRMLGAGAGVAAATLAAPAVMAAGGLAALGLGTAAAGAGAAGAEGLDLAARSALSPPGSPGAQPYHDADAVKKQLALSAIFGMTQEMGSKATGAVLSKAADTLGSIVKAVSGESPAARATVKKLFGLMDIKDAEIDARLDNPARQAMYDKIASEDYGRSLADKKLPGIQDSIFNDELLPQVEGIVQREQGEFARLKADPRMKSVEADITSPLAEAINTLKNEGYIKPNGVINNQRVLFDGDAEAMNRIMAKASMAKGMSYDEARMFAQDLGALLDKGGMNNTVYGQVAKLKAAVHNSILEALPDDLAERYGDVMEKYGPAKDLLAEMNKLGDSAQKKIAFLNRLTGDNRNAAQDMVRKLVDAGVDEDSINKLIQTEGAQNAQSWFSKKTKVLGVPLPLGGKPAALGLNVINEAKDIGGQAMDAIPYLDQAFKTLRQMGADTRAYTLKNPAAVDTILKTSAAAAAAEKQHRDALVQQATAQGGPQQ